jgi:hydrogenase maturation protease
LSESGAGRTTAVLGLGNVLMGDDALGPTVIARLRALYELPADVEVEDLGTPGLDLHPHLAGRAALIIVDTVRAPGPPGTLRCYRKDDILRHPPGPRIGPHDPGLKDALLWLQFSGEEPTDVLLVGVVPQTVEGEVGLSAPVAAAVAAAEDAVLDELRRLGHAVARRATPLAPDLWWQNQ